MRTPTTRRRARPAIPLLLLAACGGSSGDGLPTFELSASAAGPGEVRLAWEPSPELAGGYVVRRDGAALTGALEALAFIDYTADADRAYSYRVEALLFPLGVVARSPEVSVRTPALAPWVGSDLAPGRPTAACFAADGRLHALRCTPAGELVHDWLIGASWSSESLEAGVGAGSACVAALASGPDGELAAAWRGPAGELRHGLRGAGGWWAETVAAADVSAVALLREVDGSLVLHVDAGSLRIARGGGGSWTVEDALPVHPVRGPLGLARDAGGVLQVSFLAGEAALPALWHARDSGAGLVAQQVAEEVRAVSSLALAADGTLAIGAMGADGFPVELWSSPPEGSWSLETADVLSWVGGDVSLAFDALGRPHLAYQDPSRNLRHARREAGAWQVEHVDASGDVGAASHIAIAADGRVHALHHDTARDLVRWSHAP